MPYSSAGHLSNLQTHFQMHLERFLESLEASGRMHVLWLELGDICLAKSTLTINEVTATTAISPSQPPDPISTFLFMSMGREENYFSVFFPQLFQGQTISVSAQDHGYTRVASPHTHFQVSSSLFPSPLPFSLEVATVMFCFHCTIG